MGRSAVDVIVLGAGAAGLAAAADLTRAGATVLVVEARSRAGGRVYTRREPGWPLPIELGAEFIHGRPPETLSIVQAARLVAVRLPDRHVIADGGRLRPVRHFWDEVIRVTQPRKRGGKDRSFAEGLSARRALSPTQRLMAARFVEGFYAARIDRLSERSVLEGSDDDDDRPGAHDQFRILAGYDGVIQSLLAAVPPERVLLSTAARRVAWRRGDVRVEAIGPDGASRTYRARRAVVTLPVGVLKANAAAPGAVRFEPALAAKDRALRKLEMGHAVRVVFRFREMPPWPHDLSFVTTRRSPLPTWWTALPAEVPMITGWAGGRAAEALEQLSLDAIVGRGLQGLARALGLHARELESRLVAADMHDWTRDPYARGAYAYPLVGGAGAPAALGRPEAGTLYFAGEAVDRESGTVSGALASGQRAARAILDGLPRRAG